MTFVTEYIPKEDLEKYNFAELNKRIKKGGETGRDWAIDREADIWLRKFYKESDHTEPGGGYTGVSAWDFYWKGCLIIVEVKDLAVKAERGKPCWEHKKLLSINIPSSLEGQRFQIIKDLEAAFTAYRSVGMLVPLDYYSSYTFELEI